MTALDTATGKTVWKTDRASTAVKKFSFGTPLLITAGGKQQLISAGSGVVMALNPADGQEIWPSALEQSTSIFGGIWSFLSSRTK